MGGPAIGSMRITAHSSTSAPRSRSRATRPLACARARVTTMRRPCSGRLSAQASSSRSAATGPMTVTAGEPMPAASTTVAIVASVPEALRCAAVVPDCGHAHGRCGVLAVLDQCRGHRRQARGAHEHHERARQRRQRSPVDVGLRLSRLLVRRHDRDLRRQPPMRHRNACVGGHGDRRGDARDDLECDAGRVQCLRLLAAAAEEQRIAAFEAHDGADARAVLDQLLRRLLLRQRHAARLLARIDQETARRGQVEQRIAPRGGRRRRRPRVAGARRRAP